jgi:hypothetical protein
MKTVGIALDIFKVPFFKMKLEAEGYEYTLHPGLTKDTAILKVKTESIEKLKRDFERMEVERMELEAVKNKNDIKRGKYGK